MTTPVLDEPILPPSEAAAELHVEPQTLAAWRHRGEGPRYVKIGKLVFYRPSDIREWLATRVTEPTRNAARVAS
jgi:predicted DNA-binding transcriptional regulator AlpA